jgi:ribulose-phosphate 3-epimerase
MDKKVLVSPSILSADFVNMQRDVENLEKWGADLVHCDVMDGCFVPNITFGMPMVAAIKKITRLPLDVHLMIDKPEKYIDAFIDSGADILTFHPEASNDPESALKRIRERGVKAGIVLNPNIAFEDWAHLTPYCDIILIMSVYAGFGGQKFIEETYAKIKIIKEYLSQKGHDIPLEVDGGVNENNSAKLIQAGIDILVAGSAVFKSQNPALTIKNLKRF